MTLFSFVLGIMMQFVESRDGKAGKLKYVNLTVTQRRMCKNYKGFVELITGILQGLEVDRMIHVCPTLYHRRLKDV